MCFKEEDWLYGKSNCEFGLSTSSESGETSYTLCDISTPYHHGEFHKPDTASNVADQLLVRMKKEVEKNPIASVARAEEKVKHELMDEYIHDPIL